MSAFKAKLFSVAALLCTAIMLHTGCLPPVLWDPWYVFVCPSGAQVFPVKTDDGTVAGPVELQHDDLLNMSVTVFRQLGGRDGTDEGIALFVILRVLGQAPKPKCDPLQIRLLASCGALPMVEEGVRGCWGIVGDDDQYYAELVWRYPDSCQCSFNEEGLESRCEIVVDFGQFVSFGEERVVLPRVTALDSDSGWVAYRASLERKK